jgi:hypothetical protein
MAEATFSDVQYQLRRVYRNKNYIANLAFKNDAFMGLLKKRAKKGSTTGGQADMVPVQFDGAGVPSNTTGTIGTATPSQGVQFAVTPVPMTNLASLDVMAAAAGISNVGAIVKPLKHEIDSAIQKVGKVASIQLWSNGFPAIGQVTVGASTTITMNDPDDIVKFAVGDVIVFAAAQSSGALRAGSLTVVKVNGQAGTWVANANGNTVATTNDFAFIANTRNTGATKIAITGVQGWMPAAGDTLFGVDRTIDDRLIGMLMTASLADIEGAFIDGVAHMLTYSANGAEDVTAFMHPKTWAVLAKAMQSKTVAVITAQPVTKKGRDGTVSYSGFKVATPNGVIDVFTPQFCPKNKIFMMNMTTWELVGWGMDFPTMLPNPVGAGPDIFFNPLTGSISCAVGGFPQLECNAPGWNLTITLS